MSAECKKLRGPNDTGPDCGCRGDACALGRSAATALEDPLTGANCGLCGATADNFHVPDDLWERVGLGHVQACFKCFRITAWHAGISPTTAWEVSVG